MNKSAVEFASPSDDNRYNYYHNNKDDDGKGSIIAFLAHTKAIIKRAINQMQIKPFLGSGSI